MNSRIDFLSEIVGRKRVSVQRAKTESPLSEVTEGAFLKRRQSLPQAMSYALQRQPGPAVIAEFKRASPSRGPLNLNVDPAEHARAYEQGGAAAISVVTEENYFTGSLDDLLKAKAAVSIPVLRKDFIFDPYQVYESAAAGADALLLIAAALDDDTLYDLRRLAEEQLGMDALVEVHTLDELRRALRCQARLIGVNNRDLRTFEVSLDVSVKLIDFAPPHAIMVSESGLRSSGDIKRLRAAGYKGFLVGESLMTSADPPETLRALLNHRSADSDVSVGAPMPS